MSLEWISTPIDGDAPCGPDLDTSDDPVFVEYYFDALGRLPETYIKPGKVNYEGGTAVQITPDDVFDTKSVNIKSEVATITGLLERSRDLRLLALWAQFECLAGRIGPLADVIEAMADAMSTFGDDIHPQSNVDLSARRDAISELAQPVAMVTALRHIGLVGSGTVTLRLLNVADGKLSPHSEEGDVSAAALRGALAGSENSKGVEATLTAIDRILAGLDRIKSVCLTSDSPFTPNLTPTLTILGEMRDEITSARPDMGGPPPDSMAPAETAPQVDTDAPDATAAPAPRPQTALTSHAEARQALVACEVYFERNEPSSASLLLIRQARQLIGQPLIAALETLLPEKCAQALVDFGAETGFVIAAGRLKSLSDEGLPQGVPDAPAQNDVSDPPMISSTADVSGVLRTVEEFFHARERSSPVPVLLQRARGYLDKSFQEIVDELIPKPG